ncbi:Fibrous sheath-interacting protein 1 [Bulinus truncatus]|nr:Fibrous sheath-interacting protein 1 [Bulinus truncatus]
MELQAQDLGKLTMSSSDSSEEEDNEETYDLEYYEDYSPDLLGDLELKDLDEDTRNLLSSIFFPNDSDNNQTIASSQRKLEEDELIAVCNGDIDREDEEDEDDIGSEEERNILQDIKEEIENKVREEMKEELEGFHSRIKALESGIIADDKTDEEIDPKLKEAIIKMNKLDKILKKKVKQEKEVKRERLILERRIHKEICELTQGGSYVREIKLNAEKFLALELPQSHNEGVKLDEEDHELPPVFQTQIEENLLKQSKGGIEKPKASSDINNHGDSTSKSSLPSSRHKGRSNTSMSNIPSKKSKDFIKRNKKLASQADEPVAMTDDEKKRLKELLVGIDDLPDLDDNLEDTTEIDESPLQLFHHPGEGYCPDNTEKINLINIHEKLKLIMPEEEYSSIFSTSGMASGYVTPQPIFTRVGVKLFTNVDPKEQALFETKEERELNSRLLSIEKELENFKISQEMEDDLEKHLTDEQLDKLLEECVSNLSRTSNTETPVSTHRSHLSSRQHFLENPPKLTEEQLQQLLSEAHFPISSKLLALREHDGQTENDDGYFETITADTWKAIKEAQPIMGEDAEDRNVTASTMFKKTKKSYNTREQELCNLNKNMSANNNDYHPYKSFSSESNKNNSRSGDRDYLSSPVAVMSVDSMDSSLQQSYSDSACWKSSEDMKRFPKISRSCIDFTAEISRGSTSLSSLSQDNSDNELNTLHLPQLSSSSFLIHAQQGLSAEDIKQKNLVKKHLPLTQNDSTSYTETSSEGKKNVLDNQTQNDTTHNCILEKKT